MQKCNVSVYKGLSTSELEELYDDTKTIPDFYQRLQQNRERAVSVKEKLNPIHDIAYGKEPIQKLDIYIPEQSRQSPVLIDIHGGGWMAGSKNPRSIPAEIFMHQNIVWVPIDYGLAPEYKIKDMISHVRSAVAWVYENISQYGGNPERIYVSGQSAGAHLAATTLMPHWHSEFDIPNNTIKGVIALSGIYDLQSLLYLPTSDIQKTLQLTLEESLLYSPVNHLSQNIAPCIIAYGDKEPLAYSLEAQEYAKKLQTAGCKVSLLVVPRANHFDMINAIGNEKAALFKAITNMIFK